MPEGGEEEARRYFGALLGMVEVEKPRSLQAGGGCWFRTAGCEVHLGVDPDFRAQRKAHPCFIVADLEALAERLGEAGRPVEWDARITEVRRFYTDDPFGNRLEFQAKDGETADYSAREA